MLVEKKKGNVVVGIMAFIGVCVAIAAIVYVVLQFLKKDYAEWDDFDDDFDDDFFDDDDDDDDDVVIEPEEPVAEAAEAAEEKAEEPEA